MANSAPDRTDPLDFGDRTALAVDLGIIARMVGESFNARATAIHLRRPRLTAGHGGPDCDRAHCRVLASGGIRIVCGRPPGLYQIAVVPLTVEDRPIGLVCLHDGPFIHNAAGVLDLLDGVARQISHLLVVHDLPDMPFYDTMAAVSRIVSRARR
ncbi:GAF domain-containing protein [Actinoplanes sp. HUAS TT8]|uniref:GAF domain-containing protein n=1 Tax=Actinoplanes sp. HUAS TT8 TaxID=3447453 RepID=UPI003F520410